MAKDAYVAAGDREVRVSSPDRVIYEATDRTPEITKLQVCQYFAGVGDGLMRALGERPTALERWPSGVREGYRLATSTTQKDAEAFYQKRVPKGAPDYLETVEVTFPSGRTADEVCPTEVAVPVWCAQMGTLTWLLTDGQLNVTSGAAHSRADIYDAAKNQMRVELTGGGEVVTFHFPDASAPADTLEYGGYRFERQ